MDKSVYIKIKKDLAFDISNLESQLKRKKEAIEKIIKLLESIKF